MQDRPKRKEWKNIEKKDGRPASRKKRRLMPLPLNYHDFPPDLFDHLFCFFSSAKELAEVARINRHWNSYASLALKKREDIFLQKMKEEIDEDVTLLLIDGEKHEVCYQRTIAEMKKHREQLQSQQAFEVAPHNESAISISNIASYLYHTKAIPFSIAIAYQMGKAKSEFKLIEPLMQIKAMGIQILISIPDATIPLDEINHLLPFFSHPCMSYQLAKKLGQIQSIYLLNDIKQILDVQLHFFGKEKGRALINKWYAWDSSIPSQLDIQVKQSEALEIQRSEENKLRLT